MDLLLIVLAVVVAAVVVFVIVRTRGKSDAAAPVVATAAPAPEAVPDHGRLRQRLQRTRHAVADRLSGLVGGGGLDGEFWSGVEDLLVAADVGIATAGPLVATVRDRRPASSAAARAMLQEDLERLLEGRDRGLDLAQKPAVVLIVGVNGGGKTTSIAKLAAYLQKQGTTVLLGAADTFRAAADQQLRTWADRVGVDIVGGQAGADPASVAFDAYAAAQARGADAVIVDTAGRLQSKSNLMDELSKVARVLAREAGSLDEVLLVIDGTTGQNAIAQAQRFSEAVGVTGIVITKLDGTARGGVAVAIERELDIPVKFIGVGEGMDDLIPFDPNEFVDAILGS
jgi:fused signal recognition particle receptor